MRLQQQVADQQDDINESRQAREKYIPLIERTAAKVDSMEKGMQQLSAAIERLSVTVTDLQTIITPLVTERQLFLRILGYFGGIVTGIAATVGVKYGHDWLTKLLHALR